MKKSGLTKKVLCLALCTVMAVMTGCGGGSASSGTGGSQKAEGESRFVFAGPNNITQWDPLNENKTNAYMLSKLTYNTLVNPYGENNTIQPELATEWSVSDDGLEWTLKLRRSKVPQRRRFQRGFRGCHLTENA